MTASMYVNFPPLTIAEIDVQSSWVNVIEEHKNLDEETKWTEEGAIHVRETQLTLPVQREEQPEKQVDDDWSTQLDVPPKEAGKHRDTGTLIHIYLNAKSHALLDLVYFYSCRCPQRDQRGGSTASPKRSKDNNI